MICVLVSLADSLCGQWPKAPNGWSIDLTLMKVTNNLTAAFIKPNERSLYLMHRQIYGVHEKLPPNRRKVKVSVYNSLYIPLQDILLMRNEIFKFLKISHNFVANFRDEFFC